MRRLGWIGFSVLAALAFVPVQAHASEWWYVNSGPGSVLFVDAASIERHETLVTYWTMHVMNPGQPEVMTKSHMQAECGKRRLRRLAFLRFDAEGRALDDTMPSARKSVFPVAPDTLGDAEFRFACGDEAHRVTNDLFPLAMDTVVFADALIAKGNKPRDAHNLHEAMVRRATNAVPATADEGGTEHGAEAATAGPPKELAAAPVTEPDDGAEEIAQLESACAGGTVGSCAELGSIFADGKRVTPNLVRAAVYFDKACTGGDSDSCSLLGIAYYEGRGVVSDPRRSTAAFERACDLGGADACGNFGLALVKGAGIAKDVRRAVALFTKACEAGNAASCSSLGASYSLGVGVKANPAKARHLFEKACEGDDAGGCYNLGVVYDQGLGVKADAARAVPLYTTACDRDDGAACGNLGSLVQNGRGVAKDAVRAGELFRKACDLEDADGCLHLGRAYQAGSGVTRDLNQAAVYFRRALAIEPDKTDALRALSDLPQPQQR